MSNINKVFTPHDELYGDPLYAYTPTTKILKAMQPQLGFSSDEKITKISDLVDKTVTALNDDALLRQISESVKSKRQLGRHTYGSIQDLLTELNDTGTVTETNGEKRHSLFSTEGLEAQKRHCVDWANKLIEKADRYKNEVGKYFNSLSQSGIFTKLKPPTEQLANVIQSGDPQTWEQARSNGFQGDWFGKLGKIALLSQKS